MSSNNCQKTLLTATKILIKAHSHHIDVIRDNFWFVVDMLKQLFSKLNLILVLISSKPSQDLPIWQLH